jgi:DNA replication protein DnaC
MRSSGLPGWAQGFDLEAPLVEARGEQPPAFIARVQQRGALGLPAESRLAHARLTAWPTAAPWVYLWGEPGSGKTTLAMAALATRIRQGRSGLYLREGALAGASLAQQDELYEKACTAGLLLLDDLGTTRAPPPRVVDLLEGIIVARVDARRPTLITSNERLGQALVEKLGERLVQRLVQADRIEVSGFNWRLRRRVEVRRASR